MTYHRNIKTLIRERMEKENEPYSVARKHVLNKTSSLLTSDDRKRIQLLTKYGKRPKKLDIQDFNVSRYSEIKRWLKSTPIYGHGAPYVNPYQSSAENPLKNHWAAMPPITSNMYEYQIATTPSKWYEITGFEDEDEREEILELQEDYRESIFSELLESATGWGHDDDRLNIFSNSLVTGAVGILYNCTIKDPTELTLENAAHYLNDCLMEFAKNVKNSDYKETREIQEVSYESLEQILDDWYANPMNPTHKLLLTPETEKPLTVEEVEQLFDRVFYVDRLEKLELHGLSDHDKELVSVLAKIFHVHKKIEITPFSPVKLVDSIIFQAVQNNASDINLTPQKNGSIDVKLRINQRFDDHNQISPLFAKSVITRIKVLANLDINETRHVQNSQITIVVHDEEITMRIVILPTVLGGNITIRLMLFPEEEEQIS